VRRRLAARVEREGQRLVQTQPLRASSLAECVEGEEDEEDEGALLETAALEGAGEADADVGESACAQGGAVFRKDDSRRLPNAAAEDETEAEAGGEAGGGGRSRRWRSRRRMLSSMRIRRNDLRSNAESSQGVAVYINVNINEHCSLRNAD